MSYAESLRLESSSPERHEFLRGQVHAMAGRSPEHASVGISLAVRTIYANPLAG